jgi:16S rRNA (guanine527-N7)-methyltransferase
MSLIEYNSDLKLKLDIYKDLLIKWSASLNLVAKSTLSDIQSRHFHDSLQLVPFLKVTNTIVDLGAGAGFPGMVLAMYGFNVTLVDSDQKKCVFLENVSRETNTPVKIICSRVELFYPEEKFDVISARGVASLQKLIYISDHLALKNTTRGLFLKGENVDIELSGISRDRASKHQSITNPNSYIIEYQY